MTAATKTTIKLNGLITHSAFRFVALLFLTITCASALELNNKILKFIDKRFGQPAVERLQKWERIANYDKTLSDEKKLELVNQFFNQIKFVSDQEHWNKEDYWATPLELLATNAGDCEDYSIAKYFTLREMGVADEKMKITYVKALKLNEAHMVLAYYPTPESEPLILDNLIKKIKPASERDDLAPVYSFNGEGLWLSKIRGQLGKRLGSANKLDNWVELMQRHHKLLK
jgi:predicted transglutaminase-like cysteine proteinase